MRQNKETAAPKDWIDMSSAVDGKSTDLTAFPGAFEPAPPPFEYDVAKTHIPALITYDPLPGLPLARTGCMTALNGKLNDQN